MWPWKPTTAPSIENTPRLERGTLIRASALYLVPIVLASARPDIRRLRDGRRGVVRNRRLPQARIAVSFTAMSAAFGSAERHPRIHLEHAARLVDRSGQARLTWPELPNAPSIRLSAGKGTLVLAGDGWEQTVPQYFEMTAGGRILRRWYECPGCRRRCRVLHARNSRFACRLCQELDYASRHRRRFKGGAELGKIERLRVKLSQCRYRTRRYWRLRAELVASEMALAAAVRAVNSDLRRRRRRDAQQHKPR